MCAGLYISGRLIIYSYRIIYLALLNISSIKKEKTFDDDIHYKLFRRFVIAILSTLSFSFFLFIYIYFAIWIERFQVLDIFTVDRWWEKKVQIVSDK